MIFELPIYEEDVHDIIGTCFLLPPEIVSEKTSEVFEAVDVVVQEALPATANSPGSPRGVSIRMQGTYSGDTAWVSIDDTNNLATIVNTRTDTA